MAGLEKIYSTKYEHPWIFLQHFKLDIMTKYFAFPIYICLGFFLPDFKYSLNNLSILSCYVPYEIYLLTSEDGKSVFLLLFRKDASVI